MTVLKNLGGLQTRTAGNFIPPAKFDCKAAKGPLLVDRDAAGNSRVTDLTSPETKFAFDIGSVRVGPMGFPLNGPPHLSLMVPLGQPIPDVPDEPQGADGRPLLKPGIAALIASSAFGGVRQVLTSTQAMLNSCDEILGKVFSASEAGKGLIPLIKVQKWEPVISGVGARKSTNYAPTFSIVSWIERDPQLWGERTVPPPMGEVQPVTHPTPPPAPQPAAVQTTASDLAKIAPPVIETGWVQICDIQ